MDAVSAYYEEIEKIGRGTFGLVYKCRDKRNGQNVAIKMVLFENRDTGASFTTLREIGILKDINHPNIVQLLGVMHNESHVYMIMECLHTDLSVLMTKSPKIVTSPSHRRSLLKQILLGVAHCHDNGIIHRDLKPSNLLIDESRKILKVADFGYARALEIPKNDLSITVGSLPYIAPEILFKYRQYSKAVDMWSVGVTFAEMVLLRRPFDGYNENILLSDIFRLLGTPNEGTWPGVTALFAANPPIFRSDYAPENFRNELRKLEPAGVDLLLRMLCLNPSQRITAHEALEHEYFKVQDIQDSSNSCKCCIG